MAHATHALCTCSNKLSQDDFLETVLGTIGNVFNHANCFTYNTSFKELTVLKCRRLNHDAPTSSSSSRIILGVSIVVSVEQRGDIVVKPSSGAKLQLATSLQLAVLLGDAMPAETSAMAG